MTIECPILREKFEKGLKVRQINEGEKQTPLTEDGECLSDVMKESMENTFFSATCGNCGEHYVVGEAKGGWYGSDIDHDIE